MRFAQYIQATETPEWKKAYIDYAGLKTQLATIRAQTLHQIDGSTSSFGNTNNRSAVPNIEVEDDDSDEDVARDVGTNHTGTPWVSGADTTTSPDPTNHGGPTMRWRTSNQERIPSFSLAMASLPRMIKRTKHTPHQTPPLRARRSPVTGSPASPPLRTMLSNLPPVHAKFFELLDTELSKVATFYAEREKEMHERAKMLRKQLNELAIHRQTFYESFFHSKRPSWAERASHSVRISISPLTRWLQSFKPPPLEAPNHPGMTEFVPSEHGHTTYRGFADANNFGSRAPDPRRWNINQTVPKRGYIVEKGPGNGFSSRALDDPRILHRRSDDQPTVLSGNVVSSHDPHAYKYAKRRLKKAVVEHYRGLEILSEYRTLNLNGFRKVLRKYGKITKTLVLDAYIREKVEPSAFGSGAVVDTLLKEMEHLFAIRFEHGSKKKAKERLRVLPVPEPSLKKQKSSSLRFGFWLGLAVPAIFAGLYLSFQNWTRKTLPSWNILLSLYSVILIPILMALLVGANIVVWARNRINYIFIFKLDPRSRHDHQDYFELPSFLLCILAYAFWLSMAQLGPPMLWPLLCLCLIIAVMFNPLQSIMWGGTRWWTIKKVAKLFVSGMFNVEFIDLWLGDQCCSLVYSFSNLFSFCCFYAHWNLHFLAYDHGAQEVWSKCGMVPNWGYLYFFGMLPYLARFVQSLRRYRDSKLYGQLVNAGKYAMGLIQLLLYCYWRHYETPRSGKFYVLYCLASVINSLYGFAWDVIVDWSMCQPYACYPLLRRELVYEGHLFWYYFALVTDLIVRFDWLLYLYFNSLSLELRIFIAAFGEMLRRIQWSFYRVENKHVHNAEEYRVVRELSLPYMFDATPGKEAAHIARLQLKKRFARLS